MLSRITHRSSKTMPDNMAALYNRSCNYIELHENDLAIKDLDEEIAHTPSLSALLNRAYCFENKKNYLQAIKDTSQAIAIDSDSAKAYSMRGYEYYCLRNWKQALKDLNQALLLDPNRARTLYSRSLVYSE